MVQDNEHKYAAVFEENIPAELKALRFWVMWRKERREGKPTKLLYQTNSRQASSTRASTWTTFEEALDTLEQDDFFDGIGFVLHKTNPYCGADIDHVTQEKARPWINRFDSYAERSPSGEGFHIICKAEVPRGTKRDEGELYSSGRFFTVTGDVVHDAPVREAQDAADEFYGFLRRHDFEPKEERQMSTPPMTDAEVVRLAEGAKNGYEFGVIYRGGGDFGSDSERDSSLAWRLAFWTQDEAQIERIMRGSGCVREKWDKHRTYLRDTIRKALERVTETYTPPKGSISGNNGNSGNFGNSGNRPLTAAELMEMEFAPTRWVVPGILPEGVTLLAGKPKKGKSWMALGICEAVAAGGVAFGVKPVEQGDTLYLALEDNHKRLKKRLGKLLDGRRAPDRMHLHTQWTRLDEGGAELLDEWLTEHPEARLIVIDTLAKIRKPARGQNVYAEDYAALERLLPLAAKHGVAIVVVHHLRKAVAADPMDEISSSTGLTGGVDGFLILRRTPGSQGPTLYVDGRDIEEPEVYALVWNTNTASWTIEGTAEEVHISRERGDILLELNRSYPEPMTPKEIAEMLTDASHGSVRKLLRDMLADEQVVKADRGSYLPAKPTKSYQSYRRDTQPGNFDDQRKADTYQENGSRDTKITEVTAVTGDEELPLSDHLAPGESATFDQLRRIRKMVREGSSEAWARAEVLGEGTEETW